MNENNFRPDQHLLHYEQHQLLQSTAPSINALNAAMCDVVRRRRSSKGSRRTMPTTLLNANPSNFRAIVQKFTGCSPRTNVSVGKKGPVTLDFRSPASVSKEVLFPSSGGIQNYDCAINRHVGDGERHMTVELEGKQTVSYPMGQISDCALYGGCDDNAHGHHDDDDLLRECLENSSFNGVDYMDYDDFYHDAVLLEEFMMKDLDI